jgi:hypothetical protein
METPTGLSSMIETRQAGVVQSKLEEIWADKVEESTAD